MMNPDKVPVSGRGVLQRVNRALEKKHHQIRKNRSFETHAEWGRYYRLDLTKGAVIGKNVNLEKLARDLGCLEAWEALSE